MNKFEEALNINSEDWSLRLIYADYLEDNDALLANAQRWMADNKRCPVFTQLNKWVWENSTFKPHGVYTLPNHIFDNVKNNIPIIPYDYKKFFSSRIDAERSLADALSKE